MEIPPSDSRQPPDGHEFPDFVETTPKVVYPDTYSPQKECDTKFKSTWSQPVIKPLDRSISSSNYDLRPNMNDSDEEKYEPMEKSNLIHNRSQSLIDMSIFSKEKSSNSKWNTLMEQRRSRLSKLKGLVIPEAAENDVTPQVNIPEIRSITASQIDLAIKEEPYSELAKPVPNRNVTPVVMPSWTQMDVQNSTFPKYSPAFKRRSLQVYSTSLATKKSDSSDAESSYDEYISKYSDNNSTRVTDDPKSLESISSPTRSDYSFDYMSIKTMSIKDNHFHNGKDFGDSDNDSAVSSSQSSYNSRSSPPPSPTSEAQNRMLKPSSVEAINRKNILASAKCRSGKDMKIGSPVIQRKTSLEEEQAGNSPCQPTIDECSKDDSEVVVPKLNGFEIKEDEPEPVPFLDKEVEESNAVSLEVVKDKVQEKPIPTKRTHIQATPKPQNESTETRFETLLQRHSGSLEKKNQPIDIRRLKANFENPTTQCLPVFPKSYKQTNGKNLPLVSTTETCDKPVVAARRRSEDFNHATTRRKSDDKLLFREISKEDKPKFEARRLSSGSNSSSTTNSSLAAKAEPSKKVMKQESFESEDDKTSLHSLPSVSLKTVELALEQPGGTLGITLAGGVDYENKNITIHRIRYGSTAYQDGQLKKGDKVISINGHSLAGLTHSEATELLKFPGTKFSIVIEEAKEYVPTSNLSRRISSSVSSLSSETKGQEANSHSVTPVTKKPTHTVKVMKDGAGLGFSIEGGRDSLKGDVPLVVKKIFTGGAADKCGELKVGDEILTVNKINFQILSRIVAWSQMKKIPDGEVTIEIFR